MVEGYIAYIVLSFCNLDNFFPFFKRKCVFGYSWSTLLWYRCYRLNIFLPPLPEFGCNFFLEIRNPWGKVMERSGLRFEHFCLEVVQNRRADFAVQNMLKTTLPDG